MTGHGSFANVGSAERNDSISAHIYAQRHVHNIYRGRELGGSVVAFYEPPTSELGQPRPRAPHNHGGAWGSGSNGILVTDTREESCMTCAYCMSSIEGDCFGSPACVGMLREFVDTMYIREFGRERDTI